MLLGGTNTGKKKNKTKQLLDQKSGDGENLPPTPLYHPLGQDQAEKLYGAHRRDMDTETCYRPPAPNHIVPEKTKNKNRCSSTFTSNPRPSIFMALSYLRKCMHARVGGGGVADIDGEWKRA